MIPLLHRLSALALSLLLLGGNTAVCAGWTAVAEARMACCAADGGCAMHTEESHDSDSHRDVSQAQADACCASSEQETSNPSNPALLTALSNAVLGVGVVLPASTPALVRSDGWRTVAPVPTTLVPKHVLLSIFLV